MLEEETIQDREGGWREGEAGPPGPVPAIPVTTAVLQTQNVTAKTHPALLVEGWSRAGAAGQV